MKHLCFSLAMFGTFLASAQTDCGYQPDVEPDGAIGVSDVLAILGLFGSVDSDLDGIWDNNDDCTDQEACNYNANPTEACQYLDAFGVCGGTGLLPELLIGSWRMSTIAGAVQVGPAPYSSEWFSSGSNGLQAAQYDDVYTFNADGTLTTDYNGSIIDAFLDYSEQGYGCSSATLAFNPGGGTSGEDAFTLAGTGGGCSCPFIGTNDGGLVYDIVELTSTTLRLHTYTDDPACQQTGGYFTYILTRINDNTGVVDGDGYQGADSYPGKTLVWSDEFDGTTINSANWTYDLGASGWGNNEWQNYTSSPSNSSVADGFLTITAREEGGGYTSARMKSVDLQEFQFGRIDIRAKLPEGQGIWPALWMLGANFPEGGWPQCGEIDIMELVGHQPSTNHGTAHWGANFGVHQYTGSSISLPGGAKFSDAFHLFSIEWQQNSIVWYMDDQQFFSIDNTQMNGQPYPFNAPFFFIMNIAVGGNWPGYPDATTVFPQTMVVDYVRVFQ
jgi:hypothetical protein